MKNLFLLFSLIVSTLSFGQQDTDTLKLIARYNSFWFGDNYTYGNYTVMYEIEGHVAKGQITVASTSGLGLNNIKDTVLLTVIRHNDTDIPSFNFPEYDAKNNAEKVKLFVVYHDFMEGCETGQGLCEDQVFTRDFAGQPAFIIMPCGGTFSTVYLRHSSALLVQEKNVGAAECPPFFDVTDLKDGDFSISMMSCGLGGAFRIQLKSNFSKPVKVTCNCTRYSEADSNYRNKNSHEVLPEELTQVPPISETMVNYLTNYDLEKDSLGRVSKMIRTHYYEKITEITNYVYDAKNRLIREDIYMESAIASEIQTTKLITERVDFYYDDDGRRVRRVRSVPKGDSPGFVLEECFYSYNQ